MNQGNVNIFNFDEPMYGDIHGFVVEKEGCGDDSDDEPETYTCPEVPYTEPIDAYDFNDGDDEECREAAQISLDIYTDNYQGYVSDW